jgi:hypothetical protein
MDLNIFSGRLSAAFSDEFWQISTNCRRRYWVTLIMCGAARNDHVWLKPEPDFHRGPEQLCNRTYSSLKKHCLSEHAMIYGWTRQPRDFRMPCRCQLILTYRCLVCYCRYRTGLLKYIKSLIKQSNLYAETWIWTYKSKPVGLTLWWVWFWRRCQSFIA